MKTVNWIMADVDFSDCSGDQVHGAARPAVANGADVPAYNRSRNGNELSNFYSFVPPIFAFEKFLIWHPN